MAEFKKARRRAPRRQNAALLAVSCRQFSRPGPQPARFPIRASNYVLRARGTGAARDTSCCLAGAVGPSGAPAPLLAAGTATPLPFSGPTNPLPQ